jgi:nicotinamidase-related amidase
MAESVDNGKPLSLAKSVDIPRASANMRFFATAIVHFSSEAHKMGIERMVQAGAIPMTWVGVISELQYDWSHQETYEAVNKIVMEHAGSWGAGVEYYRSKSH